MSRLSLSTSWPGPAASGWPRRTRLRPLAVLLVIASGACAGSTVSREEGTPPGPSVAADEGPRVVQPGAPGAPTSTFEGSSLEAVEGVAHTEADVAFMQGMIHHHAQALDMTALIADRTETRAIHQMGLRMRISQADEIALMERWLRDRGEAVPEWRRAAGGQAMDHQAMDHESMDHAAMHQADAGMSMPGMLTPEQMDALGAAEGPAFDRLFLELMIQHHEGALVMVRDLFASPGAGQESQIYQIASEVDADQAIEIRRMREVLASML